MNEIELLLTDLLDCQRHDLYLNKGISFNRNQTNRLKEALTRRTNGEPLQYILGKVDFMGLTLTVNQDVLIPRPETEILVEIAIKKLTDYKVQSRELDILDIGTGSGCIAISLAKFLNNACITAVDISQAALRVAKKNAIRNNTKIRFLESDLFDAFTKTNKRKIKRYDLIISNPPYIPKHDIAELQREISFEPRIALDGGKDGLEFYRRIINQSSAYLKKGGLLIMEIGFGQYEKIKNMFKKISELEIIEVVKDYNKIDRIIVAEYGPREQGHG